MKKVHCATYRQTLSTRRRQSEAMSLQEGSLAHRGLGCPLITSTSQPENSVLNECELKLNWNNSTVRETRLEQIKKAHLHEWRTISISSTQTKPPLQTAQFKSKRCLNMPLSRAHQQSIALLASRSCRSKLNTTS